MLIQAASFLAYNHSNSSKVRCHQRQIFESFGRVFVLPRASPPESSGWAPPVM